MVAFHENRPLTALRGVACLWVVAHHTQALWFAAAPAAVVSACMMGHVAVDIFFVLSGFILALVYGPLAPDRVPMFWLRRICRVYPLHLTVMVILGAGILLAIPLHLGREHRSWDDWVTFGVTCLMLQSFLMDTSKWNAPSWSVGVELACYLFFPLSARLLARLPAMALSLMVVALAVAESVVLARHDGAVVGDGAILRGIVGFHLGVALAFLWPRLPDWMAPAAALAGVAGVVAGTAAASPAAVVLSASVMIVALAAERGVVARWLSTAPLVWAGQRSFSIYLLHANLIVLIDRAHPHGMAWMNVLITASLLLPLSELAYRAVEQPGRRLPGRWRARTAARAC